MDSHSALNRSLSVRWATVASMACLMISAVSQADTWTGTVNDQWSTDANWLDGSAPTSLDSVIFDSGGSHGLNIVDSSLQDPLDPIKMISSLEYIANSVHETRVDLGITLQVNGAVNVGEGDGNNGATATWAGEGSISASSLSVGWNDTGSGNNFSLLDILSTVSVDNAVNVGIQAIATGVGTADGTLVLGSNSTLNVGTPSSRANVYLGYNASNSAASNGSGVLDALNGTANLRVGEFNIGRSVRGQSSQGTLRWDQATAIDATSINISRGAGAVGEIETPAGGTLRLGSSTTPVGNLNIGWEDSGYAGAASGTLDLSVNDPTFEAVISI